MALNLAMFLNAPDTTMTWGATASALSAIWVIGDEARARFGRDVTRDGHGTCMVGIVRIEQGEDGA